MASIGERLRSALGINAPVPIPAVTSLAVPDRKAEGIVVRSASTVSPYENSISVFGDYNRRHAAHVLRRFANTNEWVRTAINRRKRQISQARWTVVRLDDPQKPPDPRVVKAVQELFRFVNPKRESFRSLMDQVMEDLLVLDAGCIEIERTLGGQICGLYGKDGSTIRPSRKWDGRSPNEPRYFEEVDGRIVARYTNDDLIYIMANPTTHDVIGYSPVEWLVRIIEAELYGEQYDFDMLKQTTPSGFYHMGAGCDPDNVEAFRSYYENEIAGKRKIGIVGDPNPDAKNPTWTPFQASAADMQRAQYKEWLAKKIAAVFEMDLGVFNLSEHAPSKSVGKKQQSLTDDGHRAYGNLVEEYITREIVWCIDENHAFQLSDLNARDAQSQAELDQYALDGGYLTPNEIRARDGLGDALPFGDYQWIRGKGAFTGASTEGQRPDDEGNPDVSPPSSNSGETQPGNDKN